jgi:hypothetical protein
MKEAEGAVDHGRLVRNVGEVGNGCVAAHAQAFGDFGEGEGSKLRRQRALAQARPMPEFQAGNPREPIWNFASDGSQDTFAVSHNYSP